jgi:hypothetical protein
MGCAGRVANGINTVHPVVRADQDRARADRRLAVGPQEHIEDPVKSLVMGLPY